MIGEFFLNQIDYIYFFYGLGFMILAASSLVLWRSNNQRLAWFWLFLFAFIHGLNEWLDLLALSIFSNYYSVVIRSLLLFISFIILVEFTRRSAIKTSFRFSTSVIFIPLIVCVFGSAFIGGWNYLSMFSRYLLGCLASFWLALLVIFCNVCKERYERLIFRIFGIIFLIYGLTQLFVPSESFWPASVINQDSFLSVLGFPVQLLRGFLALSLGVLILHYWFNSGFIQDREFRSRIKYIWVGVFVLLLILTLGRWLTEFAGSRQRKSTYFF